jgi:hypothetical protein
MSTTSVPVAQAVRPPRMLPVLVSQVVLTALIAAAFVGVYIGLQRDPGPTALPLVTTSQDVADAASEAWGDKAAVDVVDDLGAALRAVERHDAVAAFVPGPSGLALYTASANGSSATVVATRLVSGFADAAGMPLTTTDAVPLVEHDRQGLSSFYLVFGVTLAAFILAQIMASVSGLVRLRGRIAAVVGAALLSAALAGVLAGPLLGAIPADLAVVVPVLALLSTAVGLSTMAIASLIGPMGNVVATLLFTVVGNATSGATISPFLLPPVVANVGASLPQGAAFRVLIDSGYFDGRHALASVAVLVAWNAAAGIALAVANRRSSRRSETA